MTEEQLRKKYAAEYGRPLRDDLQLAHMNMIEVLALARAKAVPQKSKVSEPVVVKPPIAQKQAASVVPKAPEPQPNAPVQQKIVEKEVVQKQSVEKMTSLSEKDRAKILAAGDESSVDGVHDDLSSERNTPISNLSSDLDDYLVDEPPRRKVNGLASICLTPQPPVEESPQPQVDKCSESSLDNSSQPPLDECPQSPFSKALDRLVDKASRLTLQVPSQSTPQMLSQSTPKATFQPPINEQLNSRLSYLTPTSPMSYKSVMSANNFMSMSPRPSRVSAARQMHNVIQQIILEVEQSIKTGHKKLQECFNAAETNVSQSLVSEEFHRCYSKCIPERQQLTCVQLQRLMLGLVDAANRVAEVYNNEI
ncbi:hypothetical protein M3Y94_00072000 [Aphelenchoides besseyi]|nr:hypothetical protein M3Y94_00072000 [Aphelenchoides besseyi]